jgi:hypothetical protein
LPRFGPQGDEREGAVPEGSFRDHPVLETSAEGVFCALQGRRLPARRHPLGVRRRIEELKQDHVVDEGVVVLPGSSLPDEFASRGVLPPVERLELPRAGRP